MFTDAHGPIESFEWGKFIVNGVTHSEDGEGVGKDVCIIGGAVTPWKARHGHRLDLEMVDCVLQSDVSILVIGNGVYGRINVPNKTLQKIKDSGVKEIIVEKTPDACRIFNQLFRDGENVALLAHGTC